ncbi:MAG: carboxypeptidase regulatory-like domain-containing protein [Deltaproteobacteria bacterium]|nr:carboxypeptidase regulatory-like domain-containing protein [Deltaproteobacteria bacterium]
MNPLTPCPACARHVRERSCPFCGADVPPPALRPRFVGPATRAAIFSAATTAAVTGCWTGPVAEPATSTTTSERTERNPDTHATDTPATTGAIDGTVMDSTSGQPVAGAQVSLDGKQVTTTDYNGHYKFAGVAAGTHTITVATHGNRAHGGGAYASANVVVHGGLARADIAVVLPQPTFDPNSIPKPYGAPPARRRLV